MSTQRFRFWGSQKPPAQRVPLLAAAPTGTVTPERVTMRLYEPIDSWGGEWGISAQEVGAALDSLPTTVKNIDLHVNSPGGEVFEGVAILNLLRAHPAEVTVTVDGIAASAASFIATGAGKTIMAPNSQMMIHDAWGVEVGNAADMRAMADVLDKLSNNIADIYATGSGKGDVASWRATMVDEAWYSAEEAVAAGLADEVAGAPVQASADLTAFDLEQFKYKGRAYAPAPSTTPADSKPVAPRFTDQAEVVITALDELNQRAQKVVTFRSEQGKPGLSDRSVEQIDRIAALAEEITSLRPRKDEEPAPVGDSIDGLIAAFQTKESPQL